MRQYIDIMESILGATFYHVTPTENIPSIMQHGLVPQMGARTKLINDDAGIYLFASRDDAEDAVMNWLGDHFEEESSLSLLKVNIPVDAYTRQAFEVVYQHPIPPSRIENLGEV